MPEDLVKKLIVSIGQPEDTAEELGFFSSLNNIAEINEHHEGQLTVDVAETSTELIIVAPMAGASTDSVELHLHSDLLTIRGVRRSPVPPEAEFHFAECYWGKFSRSVVLPVDVHLEMARAEYRLGLLIVKLPKIKTDQSIPITIVDE